MKSKTVREAAFAILTSCALRYGQLEAIGGSTIAALTRNEHLAAALAELAEYAEAKHDDSRLVRGLAWCRSCLFSDFEKGNPHEFSFAIAQSSCRKICMHRCNSSLLIHDPKDQASRPTLVDTISTQTWPLMAGAGDVEGGCSGEPTGV